MQNSIITIQNPWAVYGYIFPIGIGIITQVNSDKLDIIYAEHQNYRPECWPSKKVKRFPDYQKAIAYYLQFRTDYSRESLEEMLKKNFPKAIAQTSPKCIPTLVDLENAALRDFDIHLKRSKNRL